MIIEKIKKEYALILSELRGQKDEEEVVKENIALAVDKAENIKARTINHETKKKVTENKIKDLEITL